MATHYNCTVIIVRIEASPGLLHEVEGNRHVWWVRRTQALVQLVIFKAYLQNKDSPHRNTNGLGVCYDTHL